MSNYRNILWVVFREKFIIVPVTRILAPIKLATSLNKVNFSARTAEQINDQICQEQAIDLLHVS